MGALREIGEDTFAVSGDLSFDSAPDLWRAGLALLDGRRALTLDLDEVTRTDSAGLALLVEWMREARRRDIRIRFRNLPEQLLAIARTSRLQRLLPRE